MINLSFHKINEKPTHFVIVLLSNGQNAADALFGASQQKLEYRSVAFSEAKPFAGQDFEAFYYKSAMTCFIIRSNGFFLPDGSEVDRQWIKKNHPYIQLNVWWLQGHLQGRPYWAGRESVAEFPISVPWKTETHRG